MLQSVYKRSVYWVEPINKVDWERQLTKAVMFIEIEFYEQLIIYLSRKTRCQLDQRPQSQAYPTLHIPDIILYEIGMTLKRHKRNKAPD